IKKLSPPKKRSSSGEKSNVKPTKSNVIVRAKAGDILEPWLRASPAVRQHAVDGIGLTAWFDAIPREWYPQLEQLLAEQHQPVIGVAPAEPAQASDDDGFPPFLRCEQLDNDAQAPADNAAIEEPDDFEEEDPEPEPRPKRQIKYIEHELSLANAI